MTALDMAMLLLTGGMAVTGFFRGFVEEILSLFAWVVAVVAVYLFLAPITDLAGVWMGPGATTSIISFGGVFTVTFFVGKMLAKRLGQSARTSVLGPIDRILGGGFGVLKGVIVATVVFLGFTMVYDLFFGAEGKRPEWMTSARSYPLLKASGNTMTRFIHQREDGKGLFPWGDDDGDAEAANAAK